MGAREVGGRERETKGRWSRLNNTFVGLRVYVPQKFSSMTQQADKILANRPEPFVTELQLIYAEHDCSTHGVEDLPGRRGKGTTQKNGEEHTRVAR